MNLIVSKSKNSATYYVQRSFRTDSGKTTAKIVERLGSMAELISRFGEDDPVGSARRYVEDLTAAEKESRRKVVVELSPSTMLKTGEQHCFNGGYLFLQKVYYELGLDRICSKIEKKKKSKYDLNAILSMLIYTRILYHGSKKSSLEDARQFIEQPKADLHQIYRALSLLADEMDTVQADVFRNSRRLGERETGVVYYDLTNYYFEIEEAEGIKQYGYSKEGRPNPIVQMGLFTDRRGFPLAFCIEPGNTAETTTLKPLEEKLRDDFHLSKIVVCTDGGLSSYENRKKSDEGERAFITVQSIKKLEAHLQDWTLDTKGWRIIVRRKDDAGNDTEVLSEETYDISTIDPDAYTDRIFCKERNVKLGKKDNELEQRLIVTFSFKYRTYLRSIRQNQIDRAEAMLKNGKAADSRKSQNDARRFIKRESCTDTGEVAGHDIYSINRDAIGQEEKFDGYYGICTDLEGNAADIIRINSGRWIIEDCFRITKTEFKARPVYLKRDDRIKAHFLTCFLALLIYKYVAKKVNRGGDHFSAGEIIDTLKAMNFMMLPGEGYIPIYTRNQLTNNLHGSAGFRTDYQIVTRAAMKKIIRQSKKGLATGKT